MHFIHCHTTFIIFIKLLIFSSCQTQDAGWQSQFILSQAGFVFLPDDFQALFLFQTYTTSPQRCAQLCHQNTYCRIFDYDRQSSRCRIFEGDVDTAGQLVGDTQMPESVVGYIQISLDSFNTMGQSCSACQNSRYLTCINDICTCPKRTYFDGWKCQSQKLLGDFCVNQTECRVDLNYTCLPRQQCGPESLQNGVTVAGYGNGSSGSQLNALNQPFSILINKDGSMYISEFANHRVIRLDPGSLTGTIVAGTGVAGNTSEQLYSPIAFRLDNASNIYVAEYGNHRVSLWRRNASTGELVAGTGTAGNSTSQLQNPGGLGMDSMGNLYIANRLNHRVLKWAPNATSGVLIAGNGTGGSGSTQLRDIFGIHFDEENAKLYVADRSNHRIQLFYLNGSLNGVTVAGGNGIGNGTHQLNSPYAVFVSSRNENIYIADTGNHRIQLWRKDATSGITLVGSTDLSGTSATLLNSPACVYLDKNETNLYVCERYNHRVQRFSLI